MLQIICSRTLSTHMVDIPSQYFVFTPAANLFVNKHWLHINNRRHGRWTSLHNLFSYSSDHLLADIVHSSIIENVGRQKPQDCLEKTKCPRSRPLIMMTYQKTIQSCSYRMMNDQNVEDNTQFDRNDASYTRYMYQVVHGFQCFEISQCLMGEKSLVNFGLFALVLFHQCGKSFTCSPFEQFLGS